MIRAKYYLLYFFTAIPASIENYTALTWLTVSTYLQFPLVVGVMKANGLKVNEKGGYSFCSTSFAESQFSKDTSSVRGAPILDFSGLPLKGMN